MRITPFLLLTSAVALAASPAQAGSRGRPVPMPVAGVPHGPAMHGPAHWGGTRWGGMHGGRWVGGWNAPGGWAAYRRPVRGWRLPSYWFSPGFAIVNYRIYGLSAPAAGYGWSRYYDDAVLVDRGGRVHDSRSGIDWTVGDAADGYGPEYGPNADYDAEAYRWDDRVTAGDADYDRTPASGPADRDGYDDRAGAPYPPPYNAQPPLRRLPPPVITAHAPPPPRHRARDRDYAYADRGYAAYGAQSYVYPGGGDVIIEIIPGGATTTTTTTTYYETVSVPAKKRVWHKRRAARPAPRCSCR